MTEFFMTKPTPHRIQVGRTAFLNTGLFKVHFYGPRLEDTWGWYQASALVENYKQALAEFAEWVTETQEYIDGLDT